MNLYIGSSITTFPKKHGKLKKREKLNQLHLFLYVLLGFFIFSGGKIPAFPSDHDALIYKQLIRRNDNFCRTAWSSISNKSLNGSKCINPGNKNVVFTGVHVV